VPAVQPKVSPVEGWYFWPNAPYRRVDELLAVYVQSAYTPQMLKFEWDSKKAAANVRKHGVSFEDAQTVFADEDAKLIDDPDHSDEEDRFVLLGLSSSLKTLVVCHCYRSEGNVIRIISARKAGSHERNSYP